MTHCRQAGRLFNNDDVFIEKNERGLWIIALGLRRLGFPWRSKFLPRLFPVFVGNDLNFHSWLNAANAVGTNGASKPYCALRDQLAGLIPRDAQLSFEHGR